MVDVRPNLTLELGEVLAYGLGLARPKSAALLRLASQSQGGKDEIPREVQENYKRSTRTIQVPATFEGHPMSGKVLRPNSR
jgi:hypothetical protein